VTQSEEKYTPGPWTRHENTDGRSGFGLLGSDQMWVATVNTHTATPEEGNAALIASAPEMFEALKAVEAHHTAINNRCGRPLENSHTLTIVREAIAKAEGR
jgi:hypothetical protein